MSKFGSDAKAGLDALSLILDIKNPAFNQNTKLECYGKPILMKFHQKIS